ncbi:MAG TPA: hypothetical protein VMR52_08650 [Dehalococcoidia bacterium]|nr:hypothetical protein [Dehalococcoidia bacterium]
MRLLRWTVKLGVPLVAVVLLTFMLIPAEVWDEPENDFVYTGFDPELIYVKETGSASAAGLVETSSDEISITALESSRPTVHLFTTPFDKVEASTDIRVVENGVGSRPLRLGIWSPRDGAGFFLDFEGAPQNGIVARAIEDGIAGSSLLDGEIVIENQLGTYSLDQVLNIGFSLDKDTGIASFHLTGEEQPPSGHPMLRLEGGPSNPAYRDIASDRVRVQPGTKYTFGGFLNPISGRDAYKIGLQWLDADGESLSFENDWQGIRHLGDGGWTERQFFGEAPEDAAFARMYLGSGNTTRILFSDLFLRPEAAGESVNLLTNGDLLDGDNGWQFVGGTEIGDSFVEPHVIDLESSVTAEELPGLFDSLRLTYTAVAETTGGISSVTLSNYELTIPHQRFYGIKVDDPLLKVPFSIALAAAFVLLAAQAVLYVRERRVRRPAHSAVPRRSAVFTVTRGMLWCAAAIAVFLVGNAFLFGLGSHPFDMTAEKFWVYIAVTHSPAELYYLPNFVSLADVWNGGPWHEAVFPYGVVLAYIFTGIGATHAVFLGGPGGLEAQSFSVEFTIKATIVLFGLADGVLIYNITKGATKSQRWALIAAGAFLFNPAVWFSMSVWGQTHVVSIFFVLLGIWFMFRENATGSWLSLAACALTRPQMLVPVFLLAVVLLKLFPLNQNLRAGSWTVLVFSLVLAPFSLAISPSLPIDIIWNQFYFQEAGGNEAAQTIVSLGAFSIWPLVTAVAEGATGQERFHHLAADPLIDPLTYQRVSSLLAGSIVLITAGVILFRGRKEGPAGYLLPVAIGTVGFFISKTGLAATHMLIVLPFLILCIGRVRTPSFWAIIAVWSLTTLVPMWGGLGGALTDVERLAPALHADNNPLTWLFMELYALDIFITVGVIGNIAVFVWLWLELFWVDRPRPIPREQVRFERVTAFD